MRRHPWRSALLGLLGLLLIWQAVAEGIEPFRVLPLYDALRGTRPPLQAPSVGDTALRLYADALPRVGKIARLQKGLVWVVQGRELIEEGFGLGCPIVEVDGVAYLSREASVSAEQQDDLRVWTKRFRMDTVDTPIRFLRIKYREAPPLGEVVYRYTLRAAGVIDVEVDLSGLQRPWTRAYLMNEQGARTFVRYEDSAGLRAEGRALGPWQKTTAASACMQSADGRLRFCVAPAEEMPIYWGRERYSQRNWRGTFDLAWSGLDLEVAGPRPSVRYRLTLAVE